MHAVLQVSLIKVTALKIYAYILTSL